MSNSKRILRSVSFKFIDIGISVIPWQFFSFSVAQTRGFPTILKPHKGIRRILKSAQNSSVFCNHRNTLINFIKVKDQEQREREGDKVLPE